MPDMSRDLRPPSLGIHQDGCQIFLVGLGIAEPRSPAPKASKPPVFVLPSLRIRYKL